MPAELERVAPTFALRFPPGRLRDYFGRYSADGDRRVMPIADAVRKRGHFTRDEFLSVCHWKSPRSQPRCQRNEGEFVREVTSIALATKSERIRIEILQLLHGVSWPTASVLLHLGHREPYPILDFRALWSLGYKKPPEYTFEFWWAYVQAWREMAAKHRLDARTLDRALWQYSKEHQGQA
jgi:hypothetical protein